MIKQISHNGMRNALVPLSIMVAAVLATIVFGGEETLMTVTQLADNKQQYW